MFARIPSHQPTSLTQGFSGMFHPVNSQPTTKVVVSDHFIDLSRIYEEEVNLCQIERRCPSGIEQFVYSALNDCGDIEISQTVDPTKFDFTQLWPKASTLAGYQAWTDDIILLVSAFCELFGRKQAGFRLRTLVFACARWTKPCARAFTLIECLLG